MFSFRAYLPGYYFVIIWYCFVGLGLGWSDLILGFDVLLGGSLGFGACGFRGAGFAGVLAVGFRIRCLVLVWVGFVCYGTLFDIVVWFGNLVGLFAFLLLGL